VTEIINFMNVGTRNCHAMHVVDSDRLWQVFHERYCITLVSTGLARWRYRHRDSDASPDGIMLMEPGEVHVNTKIVEKGTFFAFCIDHEHLLELCRDTMVTPAHFKTELLESTPCRAHLMSLVRAAHEDEPEAQEEQLCLAVSSIVAQSDETPQRRPGRARTKVRRGAGLLLDRYRATPWKTVDVKQVAGELDMSYHWFVHSFRSEFGLPPYRFVQSLRRAHAQRLMTMGPSEDVTSMRDIALMAGYADAPHMARDFKRTQGVSPSLVARSLHTRW